MLIMSLCPRCWFLCLMLTILLSFMVDRKFVLRLPSEWSVSAPYAIAGSTQELYTYLSRHMARLHLKRSRCMSPSLPWFFVVHLVTGSFPGGCSLHNLPTFSTITLFTLIVVLSTTITFVCGMFIKRASGNLWKVSTRPEYFHFRYRPYNNVVPNGLVLFCKYTYIEPTL